MKSTNTFKMLKKSQERYYVAFNCIKSIFSLFMSECINLTSGWTLSNVFSARPLSPSTCTLFLPFQDHVSEISDFSLPETQHQLRQSFGMIKLFNHLIPSTAVQLSFISLPLVQSMKIYWTRAAHQAFAGAKFAHM